MQIELWKDESEVKMMQDGFHSQSKSDTTYHQKGEGENGGRFTETEWGEGEERERENGIVQCLKGGRKARY